MTCQRRLNGDLCGLQVADFTDHDDIRVLAHNGPQRVGKGQPDLWLDLDLVDALHLVFHRVFYGEYLDIGVV